MVGAPASANQAPTTGDVQPRSSGTPESDYVFTFSDPDGFADLGVLNILVNDFIDGRGACYLAYSRPLNTLYLVGDSGTGLAGKLLSDSGSLSNGQCSVDLSRSSASGSGNTLTLALHITFATAFGGDRIIFLAARDQLEANSGWSPTGVVRVPRAAPVTPRVEAVSPGDGSGATHRISVTYRDSSDARQLSPSQILINSALDGRDACYLGYDHTNNQLYLVSDAGGGLLGGVAPGMGGPGQGQMENSQCLVNGEGTTVTVAQEAYTLTVDLTYKPAFAGRKIVYAASQTTRGENSGWQAVGAWTAGGTPSTGGVLSSLPENGATDVYTVSRVIVEIPVGVSPSNVTATTLQLFTGETPVPAEVVVSADGKWASLRPNQRLSESTAHTVRLMLGGTEYASSFSTGTNYYSPSFYPTPDLGAASTLGTFVPPNAAISIGFAPPVDPTTLDISQLELQNLLTGETVPGVATLVDPTTLLFRPSGRLAVGAEHGFVWGQGVTSIHGTSLSSHFSYRFRAGFADDATAPALLSSSPFDGAFGVVLRSDIVVTMSEPVAGFRTGATFKLLRNGVEQLVTPQIRGDRIEVSNSYPNPLQPSSDYTVLIEGLRDLAGNTIASPISFSFRTQPEGAEFPEVTAVNPTGTVGIPLNTTLTADFDRPLAPNSFLLSDITLEGPEGLVPISALLTAGNTRVQIQPQVALEPLTDYVVKLPASIASTAGIPRDYPVQWGFRTGTAANDSVAPRLISYTPPNGVTNAPTNSWLQFRLSEQPNQATLTAANIVIRPRGGAPHTLRRVDTVSVSDGIQVTPTYNGSLFANRTYDVTLQGIQDFAGNVMPTATWSFTTGFSPYGVQPSVLSMEPEPGATVVGLQPIVTLRFDAAISPTSVDSVAFVDRDDTTKRVAAAASLSAGATVLTLVPAQPLLPMKNYSLDLSAVRNLAGYGVKLPNPNPYIFQTGPGPTDDTPPRLLSYSPANGAVNVPTGTVLELTFSEAINPATFTPETVGIYFDRGGPATFLGGLSRSNDNRTFRISNIAPGYSPARRVTVFVTNGVQDLAGNGLGATVQFSFETADDERASGAPDNLHMFDVRPPSGTTRAEPGQPVTFFFTRPFDETDPASQFVLARDGAVIPSSIEVNESRDRVTLRAVQEHSPGSLVQGFALPTLTAPDGQTLFNGLQTTAFEIEEPDAQETPEAVAVSPPCCVTKAPVDARFAVLFSEPLDAGTVSGATVSASAVGTSIPLAVSLTNAGRRLEARPQAGVWPANVRVEVTLTAAIQDLQGTPLAAGVYAFVTDAASGGGAPLSVVTASNLPGALMPVNSRLYVRFDKPVDATTVIEPNIRLSRGGVRVPLLDIQISDGDKVISFLPAEALAENASFLLEVRDIADLTGGVTSPFSTTFDTGTLVDGKSPSFEHGVVSGDRPTNAVLLLQFDEAISPVTVHPDQVWVEKRLTSPYTRIPGQLSQSPDGATVKFTPDQPLPVNSVLYMVYSGLRDLAGGAPQGSNYSGSVSFSTSSTSDATPPELTQVFPYDGLTGAPLNTVVRFGFSEKINQTYDALNAYVELRDSAGALIEASVEHAPQPSSDYILRPKYLLKPNEAYTFRISGVTDLADNTIAPVALEFTTGPLPALGQFVMSFFPANHANVPYLDVEPYLTHFSPIDPSSVTDQTVRLQEDGGLQTGVPVNLTLSENQTKLTISPLVPLPEGRYRVVLEGVYDATGEPVLVPGNQWIFTALDLADDNVAPSLTSVSPPVGLVGAPVNTRISGQFNEALDPESLESAQQHLVTSSGSTIPVQAEIFAATLPQLILTPLGGLQPNQTYTVTVQGLKDIAGNTMTPYSWSFSTGASGALDTTPPQPVSFYPADNATGVSILSTVSITFDEPIVPYAADVQYVVLTGSSNINRVQVDFAVAPDNRTLLMTPREPLEPNQNYLVAAPRVPDLAFNYSAGYPALSWDFTTGPSDTSDKVRPTVTQMSPAPGSAGIPYTDPVLTFSEPLNPGTVNPNNFGVYLGGKRLRIETLRSSDGQTVTLNAYGGNLEPGKIAQVYVSSEVTDFAGNPLVPFSAYFETVSETMEESEAPQILGIRPESGATEVKPDNPLTMFFSKPIDGSTVSASLQVAVDGVLVPFSFVQQSGGQVIRLTPSDPFPAGSVVEVFAGTTLLGVNGLPAFPYGYSSYFTVEAPPMSEPTRLVGLSPVPSYELPPVNAEFTIRYNNPLRTSTVNNQTFRLQQSGVDHPGAISFSHGDRVATFHPTVPLVAGREVRVLLGPRILDVNGAETLSTYPYLGRFYFEDPPDTTAPLIERLVPPSGSTNVPVNNPIEIVFDEPINTAALSESDITVTSPSGSLAHCSLTLSRYGVRLSPTVALEDNTVYTVSLNGVRDLSGNSPGPIQFNFTTGTEVDFRAPYVVSSFPSGENIPRTGTLLLTFSEPLHAPSVNDSTIYLESTVDGALPPVSVSLDPTAQIVSISPIQPLESNTRYKVIITQMVQDLGGIQFQSYYRFVTTDDVVDTAPPVLTVLPGADAMNVPINTSVFVLLDSRVTPQSATPSNVRLLQGGQPVPIELVMSSDGLSIRLRPLTPLLPNTVYTVSATGVTDISGNTMAGSVVSSFATGVAPDLTPPMLVSSTPAAGERGVPSNTIVRLTFSEPVAGSLFVNQPAVPFTVEYSAGGTVATLTPRIPFGPGELVRILMPVSDLAGNALEGVSLLDFFTAP